MSASRISNLEKYPSRYALSSARDTEHVSDGSPGTNSPFARSIIEFLTNNSKESFPASDLIQFVKKSISLNSSQLPIGGAIFGTGDEGGEFVFHLRVKEKEELLWEKAKSKNNIESIENYLKEFPNGLFVSEANDRILSLKDKIGWDEATESNSLNSYENYLQLFPKGKFLEEAESRIEQLKLVQGKQKEVEEKRELFVFNLCKTEDDFNQFIKLFPQSKLFQDAKKRIEELSEYINQSIINDCRKKFISGDSKGVIRLLLSKKLTEEHQNIVFLISNSIERLLGEEIKGKLSFEDIQKERANINDRLLKIIKAIEEKLQ